MNAGNPLESLHASLAHATYVGLSEIVYEDRDWAHYYKTKEDKRVTKRRRPTDYDCNVVMFPQEWSSTALGFGGIGGQALTSAYVCIVECQMTNEYAVYFGGRHAYTIKDPNQKFNEDIANQRMADVSARGRYSAVEEKGESK